MLSLSTLFGNRHIIPIFLRQICVIFLYAPYFFVLEQDRGRNSQNLFWHDSFHAVVIVTNKITLVKVVSGHNLSDAFLYFGECEKLPA